MGMIKRAADLVYTFRFLTLLVTPFEKTEAFKLGLLDAKGKKLKKAQTSEEKNAYTPFHRLVFNVKRLMEKVPGGSSSIASYAAALYLIKEQNGLKDKDIKQIAEKSGFETYDFLAEKSDWFILDDGQISPGMYKVKYNKVVNSTYEELVQGGDRVRIHDNAYPVGEVFGLPIYEGTHDKTNQKIYLASEELLA